MAARFDHLPRECWGAVMSYLRFKDVRAWCGG